MRVKNMNYLAVLLGLVISVFLLSAVNISANEKQGFNKEEHRKEMEVKRAEMFEKLGLSDEQKQSLKAHKENHRNKMKALRGKIKEKRETFRKTLENPNVDEGAITAANNEIKALTSNMADHRLKGIFEVRKILTPEQFKKFNELKKGRKGKRRGDFKGSRQH